jgi:hypothetical protein
MDELLFDLPMLLAVPEDGGMIVESKGTDGPMRLRFTPAAADMLWAALLGFADRRPARARERVTS